MKTLKKLHQFSSRLLIACLFAACMVIGVVPIIPKRKEHFEIEVKIEEAGVDEVSTSFYFQENK